MEGDVKLLMHLLQLFGTVGYAAEIILLILTGLDENGCGMWDRKMTCSAKFKHL